ncbi:MAG TPA: carbamoyl-phosphate synthase large subunit [Dehalococcoidia bacterium]|nr:carbamoyl-phosphate synthase large subunit [Chloroflexota bacterium]HCE76289.1 carbamoyl-phosphate synthase large subunit [Dehalococcoidia bacterium]|tara:strand:- start:6746 stop:10141 length:3396 start_codon:yes stop_codon:yes gene_type:complete
MTFKKILIANRGEIAIRIARAASDLNIETVSMYSNDDSSSLHVTATDETLELKGNGVVAYLDIDDVIRIAKECRADSIHPGYGFLSENPEFAKRCQKEGITFIGPSVEMLELFGDKGRARLAAEDSNVPTPVGLEGPMTVESATEFFQTLPEGSGMMLKAIAGGGGRGTRAVTDLNEIERLFKRCQSEARRSFGNGDLYAEQLIKNARHIEVQIIGDNFGNVTHLWERECSIQRRYQKLIEIAPAPFITESLRNKIIKAAVKIADNVGYSNLGTFEFLAYQSEQEEYDSFVFIEGNSRLQVEHTVTEEVTGVDIVQSQILLAAGATLSDIGLDLDNPPTVRGYAIQNRINCETISESGQIKPSTGKMTRYEAPGGPGVRTDGFGYSGYETSIAFDSLIAKLICHSNSDNFLDAVNRSKRALEEFCIDGVDTNLLFHLKLMSHPDFISGNINTHFIEENLSELIPNIPPCKPDNPPTQPIHTDEGLAGANLKTKDPLALFDYDQQIKSTSSELENSFEVPSGPDGTISVDAPIQGTIISIDVNLNQEVTKGQQLLVMEAMKMEHMITSNISGIIRGITINEGDTIREGYPLFHIEEADVSTSLTNLDQDLDPDFIRSDLEELNNRRSYIFDENRPSAVERRRNKGQRTARENIEHLCDPDSFIEFGPLAVAAQRLRREEEWLRLNTPADGLICGVGTVNGNLFDDKDSRCLAVSYDYTVFAGTQGNRNHYKQDRVYELAHRFRLPVVLFGEGGGGRPGDTDKMGGIGMDTTTFTTWSRLSGLVPMVGVVSGRCFAGNTALVACCDVIIAAEDTTIAMGGPAMIEGGGLGVYTPEEVGPLSFQVPNGVIDILVKDEAEGVEVAKKYISYFQGSIEDWEENDQRVLRHAVPENRKRIYDMRSIIETIADKDSVLEIRKDFGIGIFTALIRVEGKPMGLIANNPHHLAGAIDSDAADKAARFLQLCDGFDLPVVSLMDCPGLMVGPEVEKTALVRHCGRLFNTGANLTVPMFGVIVRKAYGLGVQAMCGGGSLVPFFTIAWPTAEFAGMNIEGAVKLGYRKELEAIEDPEKRIKEYERMVEESYDRAKAVNAGSNFGIDDVIDPANTRKWLVTGLKSLPPTPVRTEKKRQYIDTW